VLVSTINLTDSDIFSLGFNTSIETHRTVWKNDYVGESSAKEELLLAFYVDNNKKTINIVNHHRSR
jgi:uroporphyrinogen-III synthase